MADATGVLHHSFDGKMFTLDFSMRVLAKMQAIHGEDLGGMMTGAEEVPDFNIVLDIIAASLVKGGDVAPEEADDLADRMLTQDKDLIKRLFRAAFPEMEGNAAAPKAGKKT